MTTTEDTMMTDHTEMQIPDDVMEAAREHAFAWYGGKEVHSKSVQSMTLRFARAILAERERCARITIRQAPATQDFSDAPLQEMANRIASKIRSVDK